MPKSAGLRIVWLEAFVAVADGTTQEAAARELDFDQTTVSRHVGALEVWLGKVLVDPSAPGQLSIDGQNFVITAIEVLMLLRNARDPQENMFGQLRLEWLEAFVALAETRKQAAAAAHLGIDQPTVSRHIKSLSAWLGEERAGAKRQRHLSPAGERFLPVAREVLRALNEARAPIHIPPPPERYGPATPTKFMRIPGRRDGAYQL